MKGEISGFAVWKNKEAGFFLSQFVQKGPFFFFFFGFQTLQNKKEDEKKRKRKKLWDKNFWTVLEHSRTLISLPEVFVVQGNSRTELTLFLIPCTFRWVWIIFTYLGGCIAQRPRAWISTLTKFLRWYFERSALRSTLHFEQGTRTPQKSSSLLSHLFSLNISWIARLRGYLIKNWILRAKIKNRNPTGFEPTTFWLRTVCCSAQLH